MKKFIPLVALLFAASAMFAQMPEKFVKAMEDKIALMDSARTPDGYIDLANAFERIANAEKTQWLPFYYAAYCNVMAGNLQMTGTMGGNADKTDPLADKAEALLNKAEEMEKNNSEIYAVKKMILSLRMMGDPMNRYMTYGTQAAAALAKAKELSPENPRVYILEAEDQYYTPEQYGGSKEEARKLFEKAKKLFESFKPASSVHPNWGKNQIDYFLSLY